MTVQSSAALLYSSDSRNACLATTSSHSVGSSRINNAGDRANASARLKPARSPRESWPTFCSGSTW